MSTFSHEQATPFYTIHEPFESLGISAAAGSCDGEERECNLPLSANHLAEKHDSLWGRVTGQSPITMMQSSTPMTLHTKQVDRS
jgi:hypothetical protein